MKIRWPYFILFFAVFAVSGYYREKFYVAYNHLMYIKYYGGYKDAPIDHFIFFLNGLSYKSLYFLKYPITLISVLLFCTLSVLTVKYVLNEKKLLRWVIYSYLLLLTLAGLSMLYGYFVKDRLQDDEYTLSRWLLGIAQSPIITIVILASHQLFITQPKTENQ